MHDPEPGTSSSDQADSLPAGEDQLSDSVRALSSIAIATAHFLAAIPQFQWRLAELKVARKTEEDFERKSYLCVESILNELLPQAAMIDCSFPFVRSLVTGLVYVKVEHGDLHGSSALHVVQQFAHLLLASWRLYPAKQLDGEDDAVQNYWENAINAIASDLTDQTAYGMAQKTQCALSGINGAWLWTHVESEIAAARRALLARGLEVPEDLYDGASLPEIDPIDRMLKNLLKPPGIVVLVDSSAIMGRESQIRSTHVEHPATSTADRAPEDELNTRLSNQIRTRDGTLISTVRAMLSALTEHGALNQNALTEKCRYKDRTSIAKYTRPLKDLNAIKWTPKGYEILDNGTALLQEKT